MELETKKDLPKSNISKHRWQLLRTFIKDRNLNVQHKRSHAFGLFTSCKITDLKEVVVENVDDSCQVETDYEWFEYSCGHFPDHQLAVRCVSFKNRKNALPVTGKYRSDCYFSIET